MATTGPLPAPEYFLTLGELSLAPVGMAETVALPQQPHGGAPARLSATRGRHHAAPSPRVSETAMSLSSSSSSGVPPSNRSDNSQRGRRTRHPGRKIGATVLAALLLTLLVAMLVLPAVPTEAKAAKKKPSSKKPSPKKPAAKQSPSKKSGKKSSCSPDMCMRASKLDGAIKTAKKRLIKKERVPQAKAAGINQLVRAAAKPCTSGGKPVSPATMCFKQSAELAVGAAYAALLRKHGMHVTKSTPFGISKKKGLTGCTLCERYYFPFGVTCCYIGCTSMMNLVGSSTIFLDGCCKYLTGKCEKSASTPSATTGTLWNGF